ncbi:MAG: hypothetical protein WC931_04300 [Bacilli bacterium]|jgi:hypothetical protein
MIVKGKRYFLASLVLVLSVLVWGLVTEWNGLDGFFEVRYFEILQLVLTVAIAVYLSVAFSIKMSDRTKKIENAEHILDAILELHIKNYECISTYVRKKNAEDEKKILGNFKHLSSLVQVLYLCRPSELGRTGNHESDGLEESLFAFKSAVTGVSFKTESTGYPPGRDIEIEKQYYRLFQKIILEKNELYCG